MDEKAPNKSDEESQNKSDEEAPKHSDEEASNQLDKEAPIQSIDEKKKSKPINLRFEDKTETNKSELKIRDAELR